MPNEFKYDFKGLMEDKTLGLKKPARKKVWEISTPEELVERGYSPEVAGLMATGQQLSDPLWRYGSMLLGGLPEVALEKMGYEAPKAEAKALSPLGLLKTGAGISGFVRGLPMKAGTAIASRIPQVAKGAGVGLRIGRGALRGATRFGLASALHTPKGQLENLRARGFRGLTGGVVGGITGGISGLVNHFTSLISDRAMLKTGEEIRSGFGGFKNRLTTWFGNKIVKFQSAKPTQRVDLTKALKGFERGIEDKAKFKALKTASPRLRKALKKKILNLRETQDLINQLKNTVSERQLAGFKVRPSVGEVKGFITSIQKAKHEAFPTMRFTDRAYGKMTDFTNAVENYMRYGKTAQGIKTMVSNPELKKSLQKILPKETFDAVIQTSKALLLKKEAWRAVDYLVRYGILYTFLRNVMQRGEREDFGEGGGGFE